MNLNITRLNSAAPYFEEQLNRLTAPIFAEQSVVNQEVSRILADVKLRGDEALLEYTQTFDQHCVAQASALEIPRYSLEAALDSLPSKRNAALEAAATRIRAFHEKQKIECGSHNWQYEETDGTILGQRVTAMDRVGIYVPGGKAAYPSSVLMNAIPARVAGVKEIIMAVPTPNGELDPLIKAAAYISGVDRIFTIGGAQAIGAMAYGTATIPAVDKIVGPGNAYVACAKRQVFGTVGIDMIAGPSEILIICDNSANAEWVAMDLFAQAEHDELAQAIVICPDAQFIEKIIAAIHKLLPTMSRRKIIEASLIARGAIIQVSNLNEACRLANQIAPEHCEIMIKDPKTLIPLIRHAGTIFVGKYTSESLGDYCAGANHVLPTSGSARFSSALGISDFVKRSNIVEVSQTAAKTLGEIAFELASAEGLTAHARSAKMRMDSE